jgi:hypothetical protein
VPLPATLGRSVGKPAKLLQRMVEVVCGGTYRVTLCNTFKARVTNAARKFTVCRHGERAGIDLALAPDASKGS